MSKPQRSLTSLDGKMSIAGISPPSVESLKTTSGLNRSVQHLLH